MKKTISFLHKLSSRSTTYLPEYETQHGVSAPLWSTNLVSSEGIILNASSKNHNLVLSSGKIFLKPFQFQLLLAYKLLEGIKPQKLYRSSLPRKFSSYSMKWVDIHIILIIINSDTQHVM